MVASQPIGPGNPDQSCLTHGEQNITPLAQVKRMQRVIYQRTQEGEIDNRELAQLACAWERLEERKRVMVGKPAPKPVDTQLKPKRKQIRFAMHTELDPESPETPPASTPPVAYAKPPVEPPA